MMLFGYLELREMDNLYLSNSIGKVGIKLENQGA